MCIYLGTIIRYTVYFLKRYCSIRAFNHNVGKRGGRGGLMQQQPVVKFLDLRYCSVRRRGLLIIYHICMSVGGGRGYLHIASSYMYYII
jgi:hypothetical protein